jgi:hypothetical protein
MTKHKKSILLFAISCFSMLLISCTFEEKFINENNNSKNYQLFEKKFSDIIKEKEFKKSFSKVAKPNFNGSSKTIMEQQYGFEIDETAIVKEIHKDGIITYTLGIKADSLHSNQLRNLLVEQLENNEVNAYILSYNLTAPLLPTDHNSFSLNYSTATIEAINYNPNQTSRVLLSNGCYYSTLHICYEAWSGNTAGTPHVATSQCTNPNFLYTQSVFDCPPGVDEPIGGGGPSGPSDGGGSGGSGPTSPTGPGLPTFEDDENNKECDKINNLFTQMPTLRDELVSLLGKTSELVENGIMKMSNANTIQSVMPGVNGLLTFPFPNGTGKFIFMAHTHNSPSISTYSIYSWNDLKSIADLLRNNQIDNTNFVSFLMTADGTIYAYTISNPTAFLQFFALTWDANYNPNIAKNRILAEDMYFRDLNQRLIKENNTDNIQDEKYFLEFLQDNNLGVTLFEVDNTFSNFEKVNYVKKINDINKIKCI